MINQVTLIGRLGGEPEIRTLDNGTKVGRLSLATSDSYKDKDGNWQEQTEWHNVVVWRDLADRVANLKKGALVYATGKISYRKYKDKDGNDRTATDIVASTVRRLEKSDNAGTDNRFPATDPGQQYQAAEKAHHGDVPGQPATPPPFTENLPF